MGEAIMFRMHETHNYRLGTIVCANFAIGAVGSSDDFFLVGSEPDPTSPHAPLLTGNILDSEGNLLFRIVRNVLTLNPGDCSRLTGNFLGFEIVDSARHPIIAVKTQFEDDEAVTTITGDFFDKTRGLAFRAQSLLSQDDILAVRAGMVIGMTDTGAEFSSLPDNERDAARLAVQTHGRINQVVRGELSGQTIEMDGKAFINAHVHDCNLIIRTGEFMINESLLSGNRVQFLDQAGGVYSFVRRALEGEGNRFH